MSGLQKEEILSQPKGEEENSAERILRALVAEICCQGCGKLKPLRGYSNPESGTLSRMANSSQRWSKSFNEKRATVAAYAERNEKPKQGSSFARGARPSGLAHEKNGYVRKENAQVAAKNMDAGF